MIDTTRGRFGSEAAGRGPAGGVAAIVRSGTHWVAAISISVRVRRSYSAKDRRIYLQNLAGTARCRSNFRRIYFGKSHEPLSLRTLKNVSLNRSRRLGLLGRPLLAFYRANALDLALAIS